MHIDSILSVLRQAHRNIINSNNVSDPSRITSIYEVMRHFLMYGEIELFLLSYEELSAKYTDAFDLLMEEAYNLADASSFEEFIEFEEE